MERCHGGEVGWGWVRSGGVGLMGEWGGVDGSRGGS